MNKTTKKNMAVRKYQLASLLMAWTAFSSIGIILQTKPEKRKKKKRKETQDIHGMSKATEMPSQCGHTARLTGAVLDNKILCFI